MSVWVCPRYWRLGRMCWNTQCVWRSMSSRPGRGSGLHQGLPWQGWVSSFHSPLLSQNSTAREGEGGGDDAMCLLALSSVHWFGLCNGRNALLYCAQPLRNTHMHKHTHTESCNFIHLGGVIKPRCLNWMKHWCHYTLLIIYDWCNGCGQLTL